MIGRSWACLVLVLMGLSRMCDPAAAADALYIHDVSIVSAHLGDVSEHRDVRIEGGWIVEILDSAGHPPAQNAIDGRGLFLVPGIIDSHVHVSLVPGLGFVGEGKSIEYPQLVESYVEQLPSSLLYFGVTRILDPNPGLAYERFASADLGPECERCGVIATRETYPLVEVGANAEAYPYLLDDSTPEALIGRMVADGIRCVKLYFEDGFGDRSDWPLIDAATIARIRSAAEDAGLPVFAHCNALDMTTAALDAGANVLAHGLWNWGVRSDGEGLPSSVESVVERALSRGVAWMPTFRTMEGLSELLELQTLDAAEYAATVPEDLRQWCRSEDGQWFAEEVVAGFDGLPRARVQSIIGTISDRGARLMKQFADANGRVVLGSDTPGSPGWANAPGWTTQLELRSMAVAGMGLRDIFEAATVRGAELVGQDEVEGTVEVGKRANLLLLRRNPIEDVRAWAEIESIILRGRALDREELRTH